MKVPVCAFCDKIKAYIPGVPVYAYIYVIYICVSLADISRFRAEGSGNLGDRGNAGKGKHSKQAPKTTG